MAVALLKYANRAKVAEALTARGYSVTRKTVNRWAGGDEIPGIAARMVLELFDHAPDTEKSPQPEWARAMEQRLRLELRLNRALIESEVTPDEIEAMRAELHGETPGGPLPFGDGQNESPHPRGTGRGKPR